MRGGIVLLRRTLLDKHTLRGRRGYDGLVLGDCRLSAPLLRVPPAAGQVGVQGQVASIAEGPDRAHGFLGAQGQAVSIAQRIATGYGQVAVRSTEAYAAVRTSAVLGSVGVQGQGAAVPPPGLTRGASGILFYEDFSGTLSGSWVAEQGTWAISSGLLQNTSAANMDRIHYTGLSQADGMYEARVRAPAAGRYAGLRMLVASGTDDYHLWLQDGTDNSLGYAGSTDSRISSNLVTEDGNFHVLKVLYISNRKFVVYYDRVVKLGSIASPFSSGAGPTAPGNPGFMAYNGQSDFDWILVSSDHVITLTGLSGSQGFQLFDPSDVLVGQSGTQSGGSATLDVITLVDGLFAGYIQLYDDAGTWSVPTTNGRYPPVTGVANDICGGDSYHPN